jgi:hypothetical protein
MGVQRSATAPNTLKRSPKIVDDAEVLLEF